MRKSDLFFNVLRLPVDLLMLILAGSVAYFFRTEILSSYRPVLFEFNLPLLKYLYLIFFVSLVFIGAYAVSGLYSMKSRLGMGEEFSKIILASSAGIMLIIVYIFLRQELFNSRFLVLGGWFFAIIFVWCGRLIVRYAQKLMVVKYNFGVHKLMLIGDDDGALRLEQEIKNDPASGYQVIRRITSPDIKAIRSAIEDTGVDEVILTHPHYLESDILELVELCNDHNMVFKFVPNISQLLASNYSIDTFKGRPFIEIQRTALDGWGKVLKRTVDIIGSILGLIVLSPLFGITAFAIKWETEGPVFARLKRVSKNKEFLLYKFRGMIAVDPDGGAESLKVYLVAFNERQDGPLFKIKNDPRITKVGRVIRKFRIDELAQFVNVLKGDMSLVGPRPHQPDEIAKYQKHHKKVLAIKAGATGLAQVSGSSDISFEQEVVLDSYYIDNWSFWLDFKIILKTVLKMFFDRSAV
ncbi:MAG: sugar transferase [Candidatus Taylorbacteria bacterium]|nr:sugar transferase [Candidatus Taylorbacteria bacterium]